MPRPKRRTINIDNNNNSIITNQPDQPDEPDQPRSTIPRPSPPPHQQKEEPKHHQTNLLFLLLTYPTILLTGTLYSHLDPTTRAAPYNPLTHSHPPEHAPSYFARKSNLLNIYFVKVLWGWVSIAFILFLVSGVELAGYNNYNNYNSNNSNKNKAGRARIQALLRYGMVTLLWICTTQWFFGPPVIDRGFMLSGGRCEIAFEKVYADPVVDDGDGDGVVLTTAAACKLVGGAWTGGHDISGHVFILVLGSAFLAYEVAPLWNRLSTFRERNAAAAKVDANPVAQGDEDEDEDERPDGVVLNGDAETGTVGLSLGFVAGVICTSLWMLLMTATYFHTWFEKLTGLLVAFIGIGTVYILPGYIPALEQVIGRPGI